MRCHRRIRWCHRKLRVASGWPWLLCLSRGVAAGCVLPPSATAPCGSWLGQSLWPSPTWLGGGSPMHALQGPTSHVSPSGMHPGAPSSSSRASSLSPQCTSCHSLRPCGHTFCYRWMQKSATCTSLPPSSQVKSTRMEAVMDKMYECIIKICIHTPCTECIHT